MRIPRITTRPALIASAMIAFSCVTLLLACDDTRLRTDPVTFAGQTMGTLYTVKIVDRDATSDEQLLRIKDSITALLDEINHQMSIYDSLSEISAFNRSRDTGWFNISSDFAAVVNFSLRASRLSEGAFDITVGPLVNLWGFGPEDVPREIPPRQSIEAALKNTGYGNLLVRLSPPALKKSNGEIFCDLAAVAKGFAVDRISALLNREGFANHLVEIGGEIKTAGYAADGKLWRIGIKAPDSTAGIQEALSLENRAMATSGYYLNYFEKDGVRYSHLIDPRTGYPISHHLASVTVVDTACLFADAMATAINVLGPVKGYELAVRLNLPALLIVRENDDFTELITPELWKLLEVEYH